MRKSHADTKLPSGAVANNAVHVTSCDVNKRHLAPWHLYTFPLFEYLVIDAKISTVKTCRMTSCFLIKNNNNNNNNKHNTVNTRTINYYSITLS